MSANSVPAMDPEKDKVASHAGEIVMRLVACDLRPSQIVTRESLENAIAAVALTGGSTNAVLHLLAIGREVGVSLDLEDFDRINRQVPLLADLKPGGRFVATDLHRAGGIGLVAHRLRELGALHGGALTVTGRTVGAEAESAKETPGQEVVRQLTDPIKPTGGLSCSKGTSPPMAAWSRWRGMP